MCFLFAILLLVLLILIIIGTTQQLIDEKIGENVFWFIVYYFPSVVIPVIITLSKQIFDYSYEKYAL